jgi:hypothetical protein
VQESSRVFAEGKDAESDELYLCVCSGEGVCAKRGGEAEEILAVSACVFWDLQEDLVDERGG